MNTKIWIIGAAVTLVMGCASHQAVVDTSIQEAELIGMIAQNEKLDSTKTQAARTNLEQAKAYKAEKEYEKAWAAADQSRLEYKLAFATATRDSVVREDSLLTNDLRADMERKLLYQNILENEAKIKETP
ncbi:MAG: hypothetical protein WCX75_02805 [Fibrobacteraceae bacterium]|jgi:hypothetical protein|nr:MAG: hypothetical protein AUK31_05395 [Fibrobacteres bacterium CG2_30_45_31]